MNTTLLQLAAKFIRSIMLVASVFILLRGHNAPGGGFIGGLLASAGIVIYTIAFYSLPLLSKTLRTIAPLRIVGLILALGSGILGLIFGESFLHAQWFKLNIPILGTIDLSTPLLFDIGVYLAVIGVMVMVILLLMEDRKWN
ncbi:MnhB domain-containing protein [Saccharicrinis aurantiacus]|uniref:MnhB domain-containing protein n=1 Tax=Saccharicrinis aurantiacus TaxID=1849719 RepID=UPI0009F88CFB|nr:MnhB domain-containing protein [Saccharicrinis aurantiacus]